MDNNKLRDEIMEAVLDQWLMSEDRPNGSIDDMSTAFKAGFEAAWNGRMRDAAALLRAARQITDAYEMSIEVTNNDLIVLRNELDGFEGKE